MAEQKKVDFVNNTLVINGRAVATILPQEGLEDWHALLAGRVKNMVSAELNSGQTHYGFGQLAKGLKPEPLTQIR